MGTFAPLGVGQIGERLGPEGSEGDCITRLAEAACGGQGVITDRVIERLLMSFPDYVEAIVRDEARNHGYDYSRQI